MVTPEIRQNKHTDVVRQTAEHTYWKICLKLNLPIISPLQMRDSYLILDEYVSISRAS